MSVEELYKYFIASKGVCIDTRKIEGDELFFALRGPNFNGNKFAGEALEKGCAYCVIDDEKYSIEGKTFLVQDTLAALQELAKHHRDQFSIPIIAITGSNGKTTSKELIDAVLSRQYQTLATKGNLNNHIGVPLTLLELNANHEIAIIEMGANHVGEIAFLSALAQPNFGLITNIGKAHIGEFGGFENIVKGKTELYKFLSRNGGTAFVHSDDELLIKQSEGLNTITYGKGANSNYMGQIMEETEKLTLCLQRPLEIEIKTQLFGKFNFPNAMAALAIACHFKIDKEHLKKGIELYAPENNRSQVVKTKRNKLILDAYNANPTSMMAALEDFKTSIRAEKLVILGDMLELGEHEDTEHKAIFNWVQSHGINAIFVGTIFQKNLKEKDVFANVDELIASKKLEKISEVEILIKGSRGIKLEQLVKFL